MVQCWIGWIGWMGWTVLDVLLNFIVIFFIKLSNLAHKFSELPGK